MFKRFFSMILQALKQMVSRKEDFSNVFPETEYCVSEAMQRAFILWKNMYMDTAEWISEDKGIYSLGIANEVCSELARQVTLEIMTAISENGDVTDARIDTSSKPDLSTRSKFLNYCFQTNLISVLREKLEYAMAMGGMIVRPYVSGNRIYFNFDAQGEFVPLEFNDEGMIVDVAFYDSFIAGNKRYSRVERQTFDEANKRITVVNKAFVTEANETAIETFDLGVEIPLASVPRWSKISPDPVYINDVVKPLYGYFKVPRANNIDVRSKLGVSVFSRASSIIERADHQFSRLDWEYDGGQLAIDVDPLAIDPTNPNKLRSMMPETNRRLFRSLDLGEEGTYQAFAPALRDANYINGLNTYLIRVEDLCELSRGTISNANNDARTATELIILRNRAFNNIQDNQKALKRTLEDVTYAMNILTDLYNLAPDGKYSLIFSCDDSIMSDTAKTLEEKILLKDSGILSGAEVRAWYTGETLEVATQKVSEIEKQMQELSDNFNEKEKILAKKPSEAMNLQNSVANPENSLKISDN